MKGAKFKWIHKLAATANMTNWAEFDSACYLAPQLPNIKTFFSPWFAYIIRKEIFFLGMCSSKGI